MGGISIPINLSNFRVVELSKDKIGRYLKLDVQLPDGECLIRWDLDEFTYKQIKEIVFKKHFDSLAKDYRFEIAPYIAYYQERPKANAITEE